MTKKLFISILCAVISFNCIGQYSPPSLGGGLSSLVYGKGTLDVEVLSTLIAEKQNELQKEAVKRIIINNISNGNFTFSNYAQNVIDMLLHENNKKIITKEILELTVNLALVYNFTDFYLQSEWNIRKNKNAPFKELIRFCRSRPQYLDINRQAAWEHTFNNKRDSLNLKTKLFSLKATPIDTLRNEYNKINALLSELKKSDNYKLLFFNQYETYDQIEILKNMLNSFETSNSSEYNKTNIGKGLSKYPKNIISRSFNNYYWQIVAEAKNNNFTQTAIKISELKSSINNILDSLYNSRTYQPYKSKNNNIKKILASSEYKKLNDYATLIKGLDNLTAFINSMTGQGIKMLDKYKALHKKISAYGIEKRNFNLDSLIEFNAMIQNYERTQNSTLTSGLETKYNYLLKEYIDRKLLFLNTNHCEHLDITLYNKINANYLQNPNYQTMFKDWKQFVEIAGFKENNELKFINIIGKGNRYKINKTQNIYKDLNTKFQDFERVINYEGIHNQLLNLENYIGNLSNIKNPNMARYDGFITQQLSNIDHYGSLNQYYQLLSKYKSHQANKKLSFDYDYSYIMNIDLASLDFDSLNQNSVYISLDSHFKLLKAIENDYEKFCKYVLKLNKDSVMIQSLKLDNEYEILKNKYDNFDETGVRERINYYQSVIDNLENMQRSDEYSDLNTDLQYQYYMFLLQMKETKLQVEKSLNIRNWREYKDFIGQMAKWKFLTEKQEILNNIKKAKSQVTEINKTSEYTQLFTNLRKNDLGKALLHILNSVENNELYNNEKTAIKSIKSSATYSQIIRHINHYNSYYHNSIPYQKLQKLKSTLDTCYNIAASVYDRERLKHIYEVNEFKTKILILEELSSRLNDAIKQTDNSPSLNMILLDMAYDVCYNSETIKRNGFFKQPIGLDRKEYESKNTYLMMKDKDPEMFALLEKTKASMKKRIEFFFKYYQLIQEMNYFDNQSTDNIRNNYIKMLQSSLADTSSMTGIKMPVSFTRLRNSIDTVETIFYAIDHHFNRISSETSKIKEINDRINSINIKNIKFGNDETQAKKPILQKQIPEIDKIKDMAAYVKFHNIFYSLDSINNLLRKIPGNLRNSKAKQDIYNTFAQYSYLGNFDYAGERVREDAVFVNLYRNTNDSALHFTNQIQTQINDYKRELYASLFIGNDYLLFNLKAFKKSVQEFEAQNLSNDDKNIIAKVYGFITLLEKPNNNVLDFEFLNFLRSDIIPKLVAINIKYKQHNLNKRLRDINNPVKAKNNLISITNLENILNYGYFININQFYDPDNIISREVIDMSAGFVDIVGRLNQLDEVKTYEHVLNTLSDAGNVFTDRKSLKTFNDIINNVCKFTHLDNDNNQLKFDIESVITILSNNYKNVARSRTTFYFSVGLNQNIFIKNATFEQDDNSQIEMKQIAFASEKIGLKFNVIDFNKNRYENILRYNYNDYKSKKPYINDLHLIVYGSGLLYNIVNTTTNDDFDFPVVGTGIGFTFYNSLDFNITYSIPIIENAFDKGMIGFSFDIKIGEYLSALGKKYKRKEK